MRLALLIAMLAVAGCATPRPTVRPTVEQVAASDDSQCRSYGAQPGTDMYVQCRMGIEQQRQQGRAAVAAAILSKPPASAPQPYVLPPVSTPVLNPIRTPVNCTSTAMGNTVNTNCY